MCIRDRAWAIRIYHKPFVRFIWLGALLMMAGGFLAASDKRYRRRKAEAGEKAKTDAPLAEAPA